MCNDYDILSKLADQAQLRAIDLHAQYEKEEGSKRASLLNDFFYWSGKASAYKGIAAGIALREVVEEEKDAAANCP